MTCSIWNTRRRSPRDPPRSETPNRTNSETKSAPAPFPPPSPTDGLETAPNLAITPSSPTRASLRERGRIESPTGRIPTPPPRVAGDDRRRVREVSPYERGAARRWISRGARSEVVGDAADNISRGEKTTGQPPLASVRVSVAAVTAELTERSERPRPGPARGGRTGAVRTVDRSLPLPPAVTFVGPRVGISSTLSTGREVDETSPSREPAPRAGLVGFCLRREYSWSFRERKEKGGR
ncbi:hypothetical protein NL676_003493 [Syzygium grande]|nr:hypothetical protein NL676_003493 [Syzygium grande]